MIEKLYGPLKMGSKKKVEKPEPVYFRQVFLNVFLPRMARMEERGIVQELVSALEAEDVPLQIRENVCRYLVEGRV
jgi:hypothetical protein